MIASLRGQLIWKAPSQVTLDVHGVGYEVFIPLSTFFALPNLHESVSLQIYTHLRDNAIQLFGFLAPLEREAFVLLTGISGIGPRLALSALSTLSVPDLVSAIESNDVEKLASIPGIGKKSASRIPLELKDKVARLQPTDAPVSETITSPSPDRLESDAISALVNLGYRRVEVKEAIKRARTHPEPMPLEDLIRTALKELTKF